MIGSPSTNDRPASSRSRVVPSSGSIGGSGERIRRRKKTEPRNDSGVGQHRDRRAEDLDEQPADRRAADRRERPAAVEQGHRLDVAVALGDRHEQRVPRQVEDDRQRARQEADDVELRHRQDAHDRGDRDAGDQRGPAKVGARSSAGGASGRDRARRRPAARRAGAAAARPRSACPSGPASAPRVRTATSGSPSWVTWSPKTEIVWPSQSRRKSGASKRSGGSRRRSARGTQTRSGRAARAADGSGRRVVLLLGQLLLDFLVDLVLAVLPNAPDHDTARRATARGAPRRARRGSTAPSWVPTVSRGR